jgi:hypothetical protein
VSAVQGVVAASCLHHLHHLAAAGTQQHRRDRCRLRGVRAMASAPADTYTHNRCTTHSIHKTMY